MSKSSLINQARNNYKASISGSWILGLTTGLLIAAILAIDLVAPGLVIITFPFLILPIILGSSIQHIMLRRGDRLTVLGSVRSFTLYFSSVFFGCFSLIISLLKTVLFFVIVEFLISLVTSTIFQLTSPAFVETMTHLTELLESAEATTSDILPVLEMNGGILNTYIIIVFAPSILMSAISLIYLLSRNSITIYLRMRIKNSNPRFIRMIYGEVIRRNRFRMLGDYLLLNWPLYFLLIIGFAGGAVLGYFWKGELAVVLTCAFVLGAILASFFLPFYFANNEALYEKYEGQFKVGASTIANMLVRNLQQNIDLSMEEKKDLERTLAEANNPLDDGEENEEEDQEK